MIIQLKVIIESGNENSSDSISIRYQKNKHDEDLLQGEIRKIKHLAFHGVNSGESVEMWLLEMNKYFQLHGYSNNQEARIAIYNIQ